MVFVQTTEAGSPKIQTLLAVQQAITCRLDLDTVLQLIADEARKLTRSHWVAVFLLEKDTLVVSVLSGDYPSTIFAGYRMPIDRSVTGLSIRSGQPLLVSDVRRDPRVNLDVVQRTQIRSLISVPLISNEHTLGAILVADRTVGSFTSDDQQVLSVLASSAVVGLENARLYRAEQTRRREAERRQEVAESLRDILTILNSNRPLDEILDYILGQAIQLLNADAGAIYHVQSEGEQLCVEAVQGLSFCLKTSVVLSRGRGMIGQAVLQQAPVTVTDLSTVIRVQGDPDLKSAQDAFLMHLALNYRSALAVPLIIKEEVYGGIELYYGTVCTFSEEEIRIALAIADQVALAIETARLYHQSEELARLRERHRIAEALHDTVAQMLFGIGLETEGALELLSPEDEMRLRLEAIRRLVARSSHELRSAIYALRGSPYLSGDHSLVDLLQEQVSEFQVQSGIAATLITSQQLPHLPPLAGEAIFRIVRESLANVQKHAHASAAIVSLHCSKNVVTVTIQDNGVGLQKPLDREAEDRGFHFGVASMRQLTEQAGGDFMIANNDDQGLMIKARFPIPIEKDS